MAVATVLNITENVFFVMPVTVICAVIILGKSTDSRLKGDAAIAVVSVGALGIGYLLMNIFSTSSNLSGDVCSALFGSSLILSLTKNEVWFLVAVSVIVITLFAGFYRYIFSVAFDEEFASASGINVKKYNFFK